MYELFESVVSKVLGLVPVISAVVSDHFVDWLITAVITYFTVKSATRQFYYKNRIKTSKNIMEQGLGALLNLQYNENLPESAQAIFVAYKGRYWGTRRRNHCKFFDRIRKTITSVGGNSMRVSPYRPRDYGVLGVANQLNLPVQYDFQNGELNFFDRGKIYPCSSVVLNGEKYYYVNEEREQFYLSNKETTRGIMIAIPISKNGKQIGGLTFDLAVGSKTLYQKINEDDSEEIRNKKNNMNKKVFQDSLDTAMKLIDAFFVEKGD